MLDLSELEQWREGNRLEVKAAQGGLPGDVWPSVSAFANTNGGLIVLGVKENTKTHELFVLGLKDARKMLDDFTNAANSTDKLSYPIFSDENLSIQTIGGREVIAIEVPRVESKLRPVYEGHDPYKGSYRRKFTGDYHCTREEVAAMLRDASEDPLDMEPVTRSELEDLDKDTIRAYRALYAESHKTGKVRKLPDDEFLRHIGAAVRDEDGTIRPTRAGLLMFGQEWCIVYDFPNYFLDYRKQTGGNRRWEDRFTSQDGEWSGNLFDFYERTYDKMKQALEVPFKLEGIYRVDETPAHEALREAIVNALANADFKSSRGVVFRWTADAIELVNPGCFRTGIEQAYAGGISDARNKTVLKLFSLIKVGERAGSGVPNMVDQWETCGYGRPVLSETFDPEVSTTILPLSKFTTDEPAGKSAVNVGSKTKPTVAERNDAIVAYLATHGESRSADIAESIGLGASRTNDLLRGLAEGGIVEAVGGYRNRRYKLADR